MPQVVNETYNAALVIGALFVSVIGFMWLISSGEAALRSAQKKVEALQDLGAYRIGTCIGEGGMGEVWTASHRLLARPAAIKLIRPDRLGEDPAGAIARFTREARATAALRSPHTVELFDFGQTDKGTFYFVMELLEGIDLQQFVTRYGPLEPPRVLHILRQVCRSLAEAHAAGLVHRDVKPANLFLCRLGRQYDCVKVLDFGLVRPALAAGPMADVSESPGAGLAPSVPEAAVTEFQATVGTPAYMPPEQVKGEEVDGRSDLYALGCVAYWLLTGQQVFEASTLPEMLMAHLHEEPVPPSRVAATTLPAGLEAIIMRCLAKQPANRPPGAEELARELASVAPEKLWTEEAAARWWSDHEPAGGGAPPETGVGSEQELTVLLSLQESTQVEEVPSRDPS